MNADSPVVVRYFHRLCNEARQQLRGYGNFEQEVRSKGMEVEDVPVVLWYKGGVIYQEKEEESPHGLIVNYHIDSKQIDFVKINLKIQR